MSKLSRMIENRSLIYRVLTCITLSVVAFMPELAAAQISSGGAGSSGAGGAGGLGGTASGGGGGSSGALEGVVTNGLCVIISALTGDVGKAVATLAIVFLGVGAFFGKVNWGLALMFAAGIVAIFGAAEIASGIASGSGSGGGAVNC